MNPFVLLPNIAIVTKSFKQNVRQQGNLVEEDEKIEEARNLSS